VLGGVWGGMAIKHLDKKSVTEPKRGKVQQEAEQLLRIFSNIYVNSGSALSDNLQSTNLGELQSDL